MMRTRAALLLLLPLLASCSLALTHEPPSIWDTPGGLAAIALDPNPCSTSTTWGVVDIGLALTSLFAGYLETVGTLEPGDVRGQYIWLGAVVGLGFAASASVGLKRADECRNLLVAGRGDSPGALTEDLRPRPPPRRSGANVITAEELNEFADRSLYDAIRVLRAQWLRGTGARNDLPSAVVDNQRFELDILESMRPDEVESVSLISPSDATIRWGTGYTSGVIEVLTRRR